MKKAELIIGQIAIFAIILNLLDLPGSGVLMFLSISVLVVMYLFFSLNIFREISLRKIFKKETYAHLSVGEIIETILFGIALSVTLAGNLEVLLERKEGKPVLTVGLSILFLCLIYLFILNRKEKWNELQKMFSRAAIGGGLGILLLLSPLMQIIHRDVPVYHPQTENSGGDAQLKDQFEMQRRLMDEEHWGMAILILLVTYGYYRFRQKKERDKLIALQKERERIAADLHDEIGSTLSSIRVYSDVAKNRLDQNSQEGQIMQRISESTANTMEAMSDIVWTLNPKNDAFENLVVRMQSFASQILEAKNIELKFLSDEKLNLLKLSMDQRQHLYLIFKEAINNMAKYSGATVAEIRIGSNGNDLTMMISDNGKGFNPDERREGNGLRNMQMRAKQLNAQIKIESSEGKGTKIFLAMKNP